MRPLGEAVRRAAETATAETISENAAANSLAEEVEGIVLCPCVSGLIGRSAGSGKQAGGAGGQDRGRHAEHGQRESGESGERLVHGGGHCRFPFSLPEVISGDADYNASGVPKSITS